MRTPTVTITLAAMVASSLAPSSAAQSQSYDYVHPYQLTVPAPPSGITGVFSWNIFEKAQTRRCKYKCDNAPCGAGKTIFNVVAGTNSHPNPAFIAWAPDSTAKAVAEYNIASVTPLPNGSTQLKGYTRALGTVQPLQSGCSTKRRRHFARAQAVSESKVAFGWGTNPFATANWVWDVVNGSADRRLGRDPIVATLIDHTDQTETSYTLLDVRSMVRGGKTTWKSNGDVYHLSNDAPDMLFEAIVGDPGAIAVQQGRGVLRIVARDNQIIEIEQTGIFSSFAGGSLHVGSPAAFGPFVLDPIDVSFTLPANPAHNNEIELSLGGGGHEMELPPTAIADCMIESDLFSGFDGADISAPSKGYATLGLEAKLGASHVADEFTVPQGPPLYLDSVIVHAYQDGAPAGAAPTIDGAYVRVWGSGPPGTGVVVAGDLTTNRIDSVEFMRAYRVAAATPLATSKAIQELELDLYGLPALPPGTYWLEIALVGDPAYGTPSIIPAPWPSSGDNARRTTAFPGGWTNAVDSLSGQPLALCLSITAGDIPPCGDAVSTEPPWIEDFDCYLLGRLDGIGGWEAWNGDPNAAGFDVDEFDPASQSDPQVVAIDGLDDAVRPFKGCGAGTWRFTAWSFVPGTMNDQQSLSLLNTYPTQAPSSHSLRLELDGQAGVVRDIDSGNTRPLVKNAWTKVRVDIDLDHDVQSIYYNGALLATKSWTGGVAPGGTLDIAAVELRGEGSSHLIYYDDMSLRKAAGPDIDGNGVVDGGDLGVLLGQWGTCPNCSGDLNGDGVVNGGDLGLLLGNWGIVPAVGPVISIARQWDEQAVAAIRLSTPRPPVQARNLYHVSAAMYDAWATYDAIPDGVFFLEKHTSGNLDADRREAISYAAYRVLKARFVNVGPNGPTIQAGLDAFLASLGYDKNNTSTVGNSPAAIGNRIAAAVLAAGLADGSNEAGNYAANNGYAPSNAALPFKLPGAVMNQASRWQPLGFDYLILQNGEAVAAAVQQFVCPHWKGVAPFGMTAADRNPANNLYFDQGPPPQAGSQAMKDNLVDLVDRSAAIDPSLGTTIDIAPGVYHNSPLGSYQQLGHGNNPVTGAPYASNVVDFADYVRAATEFWINGQDAANPAAHWHVLANSACDTPGFQFKIGGLPPTVSRLEWDVKMYLALSGANHDAAITAWGMKGHYDSVRPISAIRHHGEIGQSSSAQAPNYNPAGMPLVPGLIEQVAAVDVAPGGDFQDLPELVYDPLVGEPIGVDDHVGDIVVRSWLGGLSAGLSTTVNGPLPGHVYRNNSGWHIGGFEPGADDSPGVINAGYTLTGVRISEIRVDQPGDDFDEYAEISGPPNASLNGKTYIVIGDEFQSKVPDSQGRVQVAIDLSGHSIGPNGTFVIGKSTLSLTAADLVEAFTFRHLANCTHAIVSDFSGSLGMELDYFDDGVLDLSPWGGVVDSVGLRRTSNAAGIYSATTIGPDASDNQTHGTGWSLADRWMPHMPWNVVTPPFAGYVSGHSTMSRASATVLAAFTGSPYFPCGLREESVNSGELAVEQGPTQDVTLQWASYFDASDEAGVAGLFAGINTVSDDLPGRMAGDAVGQRAIARAFAFFTGVAVPTP